MSCPTCFHSMQLVQGGWNAVFWCPRCGTIKNKFDTHQTIAPPFLIERLHKFRDSLSGHPLKIGPQRLELWIQLGIEEAIELPDSRVTPERIEVERASFDPKEYE